MSDAAHSDMLRMTCFLQYLENDEIIPNAYVVHNFNLLPFSIPNNLKVYFNGLIKEDLHLINHADLIEAAISVHRSEMRELFKQQKGYFDRNDDLDLSNLKFAKEESFSANNNNNQAISGNDVQFAIPKMISNSLYKEKIDFRQKMLFDTDLPKLLEQLNKSNHNVIIDLSSNGFRDPNVFLDFFVKLPQRSLIDVTNNWVALQSQLLQKLSGDQLQRLIFLPFQLVSKVESWKRIVSETIKQNELNDIAKAHQDYFKAFSPFSSDQQKETKEKGNPYAKQPKQNRNEIKTKPYYKEGLIIGGETQI